MAETITFELTDEQADAIRTHHAKAFEINEDTGVALYKDLTELLKVQTQNQAQSYIDNSLRVREEKAKRGLTQAEITDAIEAKKAEKLAS